MATKKPIQSVREIAIQRIKRQISIHQQSIDGLQSEIHGLNHAIQLLEDVPEPKKLVRKRKPIGLKIITPVDSST